MPQTYGADVPQCPRCRRETQDEEIHCTLTLPLVSTPAAEALCNRFMAFMMDAQQQIVRRVKGESLRPFMAGALIATVQAPRGGPRTLQYVGASGRHVPTRRWNLSGVAMVTRTAWVATGSAPRMAGWNYARRGEGFSAKYNGAAYTQTEQQFGSCAAPKLLRACYEDLRENFKDPDVNARWNLQQLQLSEMWWHPEETSGRFRVIASCQWCQQLLPQMLCMRL